MTTHMLRTLIARPLMAPTDDTGASPVTPPAATEVHQHLDAIEQIAEKAIAAGCMTLAEHFGERLMGLARRFAPPRPVGSKATILSAMEEVGIEVASNYAADDPLVAEILGLHNQLKNAATALPED